MTECPRPDKAAYTSRREAAAVRSHLPKWKRKGARPYRCVCGWWHLGRRMRRATAAWRNER